MRIQPAHEQFVATLPRRQRLFIMWQLAPALILIPAVWAQDPLEIVRRSVEHDRINLTSRRDYTYHQREEDREFDENGDLKKKKTETDEVLILAGRPYERVVARDGRPLSGKEAGKEREKMDQELARREHLTPAERIKDDKQLIEERKILREIPGAFDFKLLGEEDVSGERTWVIDATPKPGYQPKSSLTKILPKIHAKLWIAQDGYQWVKLEADALEPLSFGLGLFRVAPGASLLYEQTLVNNEAWLPAHVDIHAATRLGYVKKTQIEIELTYRDYRKFQADSRIVAEKPVQP